MALGETKLPAVRDDSSFVADDGSTIYSFGFMLLNPEREYISVGSDEWLQARGCRLCRVAGLTHHPQAAQEARFAPGSVVVLAPEPNNPADPHAVSVWDATGEQQLGYVPAEIAPEIAERIAGGEPLGAAIVREHRSEPEGGRRLGLVMLIAPAGRVTLSVEPGA